MAIINAFRRNEEHTTAYCYKINHIELFELKFAAQKFLLLPEGEDFAVWMTNDKLADYKAPEIFVLELADTDRTSNKLVGKYLLPEFRIEALGDNALFSKL